MDGQKDLRISDLLGMQEELQEKYKGIWEPVEPERARLQLLWLVEELGEVVSIVKKRKVEGIMEDPAVRARFLEEMSDVLMYFTDVLLCLGVTAEEFSAAYEAKHQRNMRRDFVGEHRHYLQEGKGVSYGTEAKIPGPPENSAGPSAGRTSPPSAARPRTTRG